jgi:hypothetical protein
LVVKGQNNMPLITALLTFSFMLTTGCRQTAEAYSANSVIIGDR